MSNDWESSFAVVTGMVEIRRGWFERGPGYRVVQSGLALRDAQRLAAEVNGLVTAPGVAD